MTTETEERLLKAINHLNGEVQNLKARVAQLEDRTRNAAAMTKVFHRPKLSQR